MTLFQSIRKALNSNIEISIKYNLFGFEVSGVRFEDGVKMVAVKEMNEIGTNDLENEKILKHLINEIERDFEKIAIIDE